jgi:hypothetical protein
LEALTAAHVKDLTAVKIVNAGLFESLDTRSISLLKDHQRGSVKNRVHRIGSLLVS